MQDILPGHHVDPRAYLDQQRLGQHEPSAPVLSDREAGLSFSPVLPQYYPFLYALSLQGNNSFRWRYRNQIPAFDVFVQQIDLDVLCHFIIEWQGHASGYVVAYGADTRNGHCHIGVVLAEHAIGHSIGIASLDLLKSYVIRTWPMRKVYLELPEFTARQLSPDLSKLEGFVVEGVLTDHIYCDGQYWDMIILAIADV